MTAARHLIQLGGASRALQSHTPRPCTKHVSYQSRAAVTHPDHAQSTCRISHALQSHTLNMHKASVVSTGGPPVRKAVHPRGMHEPKSDALQHHGKIRTASEQGSRAAHHCWSHIKCMSSRVGPCARGRLAHKA